MENSLLKNFIERLENILEVGELVQNDSSVLTREIAFPIPNKLIEEDNEYAIEFVKKARGIRENSSFNLPVIMENEEFDTGTDKIILLNFVFKVNKDTKIKEVINFIEK